MQRILTVLVVALVMAAMVVATAMPAFADPKGGNFKPGPAPPDLNFKSPNQGGF
jgi:hypothetical protein